MEGPAHRLSGVILGASFFYALEPKLSLMAALPFYSAYMGSTAPDWLETLGPRIRWVRHRTLTHWWLVWTVLAAVAFFYLNAALSVTIMAFCAGAMVHVLGDALTPMGVPVLHPGARKTIRMRGSMAKKRTIWLVATLLVGLGFIALARGV